MLVNNKYFHKHAPTIISINTWIHVAMVYRGPDNGIMVYHDGVYKGSDTSADTDNPVPPSGIVKISRQFDSPGNPSYDSVNLDELLFWNRILVQNEIEMIKNMGWNRKKLSYSHIQWICLNMPKIITNVEKVLKFVTKSRG